MILQSEAFAKGDFYTSFIEKNLEKLVKQMEELFKERREKLNILKNLRRKPKEEKKVSNTSSVPEGLYTKCPECEQGYLSEDVPVSYTHLISHE